ncbi:hypothetical protein ACIPW5_11505 [Streptomyces sp. NPDC090077]|uniref:hypothetical protein n=1 Tax=Streptomyces sp. NPDC090077 TaxID=3365938 RepID=UPI0037FACEB0
MVATDPLWLGPLTYDQAELRAMDSMMVMANGSALGSRAGIRAGDPGLAVSLAGTTVNVTGGVAILHRASQGVYRAQLAATSPGTLSAAHASFTRIDLVYLRVWDTTVDSSGLSKADTVYLAGTPSGSPVAPTPGGTEIYIPLATITVPSTGGGGTGAATVSSTVRQVTVAPGGILPVTSATDIAISGTYTGQTRYNTVRGTIETWNGSAWVAPGDWVAYTPTWTATVNPSLGNGTIVGRYSLIGKTCHVRINMIMGSTTTYGSGEYKYLLPFTAATLSNVEMSWMGSALGIRPSTSYHPCVVRIQSAGAHCKVMGPTAADGSSGATWNPTVPITWANTHQKNISATYEIA